MQLIPDSKKSSEDIQWRKIASVISFGLIPLAFKIYESILVPLASKINNLVLDIIVKVTPNLDNLFEFNDLELLESSPNYELNLANPDMGSGEEVENEDEVPNLEEFFRLADL